VFVPQNKPQDNFPQVQVPEKTKQRSDFHPPNVNPPIPKVQPEVAKFNPVSNVPLPTPKKQPEFERR